MEGRRDGQMGRRMDRRMDVAKQVFPFPLNSSQSDPGLEELQNRNDLDYAAL